MTRRCSPSAWDPHTSLGPGVDDRLVAFFAEEFTKKTKEPLALPAQNE